MNIKKYLNILRKIVVDLIDSQNENIKIHPAHGESSTIKHEKETNYYYNTWKDMIK